MPGVRALLCPIADHKARERWGLATLPSTPTMQEASAERTVFAEDTSVRPHKRSRHDFEAGGGMDFGEGTPKEHVFIADSVMGAKKRGKKVCVYFNVCQWDFNIIFLGDSLLL